MKVIVTGATGLVGSALVRECITNPAITSAFVLTRKSLSPEIENHPKIKVIIHHDFRSYPPEILEQLDGAEGCLWAIGGPAYRFPDLETCKKVSVDFTLVAAKAFVDILAPNMKGGKFRFIFCSGMGAEVDDTKTLRYMKDTRRIKGQVERELYKLAEQNKDRFEIWSVRPGGILPTTSNILWKFIGGCLYYTTADRVASSMIQVLLHGYTTRLIEHGDLLNI
ncbi:hypothetical protein QSH57_004294 [Fusarium oxysporum f. sp. vasinfectum]|nr:hypothetical protein QSH57_004294 [Fusarium oxysporum f. sp. vasinfectum]